MANGDKENNLREFAVCQNIQNHGDGVETWQLQKLLVLHALEIQHHEALQSAAAGQSSQT